MLSIELYFDAASEARLRGLWEQFAAFGSPFMRDNDLRPHLTFLCCESVEVTAASCVLDRFAAQTPSFPISLAWVGLFPMPQPVVFLAPTVTTDLLDLQARLFAEVSAVASRCDPLYTPGLWVPHCTLSPGLSPKHLGEALDACRTFGLPFECWAVGIALVEYWPYRQLHARSLASGQDS